MLCRRGHKFRGIQDLQVLHRVLNYLVPDCHTFVATFTLISLSSTHCPTYPGTQCATPEILAHTVPSQRPHQLCHMLRYPRETGARFAIPATPAHTVHHSHFIFIEVIPKYPEKAEKIVNFSTGARTNKHFLSDFNIVSFTHCPGSKANRKFVTPVYWDAASPLLSLTNL